ncbi:hypothetical protein ACQPW3_03185 [Actinosynnema sp. CA-248983]
MASIEEVRAAIAQAVEKAGQSAQALQQAADLAEDAQALLSTATQGSAQADVEQANAQFAEVVSGVTDLQKFLAAGINQADNINSRL